MAQQLIVPLVITVFVAKVAKVSAPSLTIAMINRFRSCINHTDDHSDAHGDDGRARADRAPRDHRLCGQDKCFKDPISVSNAGGTVCSRRL